MEDLQGMTKDQLQAELKEVESDLEDLLEEKEFSMKQTGLHVYAEEVSAQRQAWERDEQRYKERIEAIKSMLAQ